MDSHPTTYTLAPITTPDQWETYHRICKESIFDGSGITYNPNHESLRDPNYVRFVFLKDKQCIGVLVIEFIESNDAIIRIIAIDEPYRNHGLGSEFEKMAENWLQKQGKTRIFLHADPQALSFYHRLGYTERAFPNGDKSIFEDNVEMGKNLGI